MPDPMPDLMAAFDRALAAAVGYAWGAPLVALLLGGGLYLTLLSRFLPFFGARHAFDILRGKFDRPDDPGQISHFQALSTALSSTVGLGNIGGVAIAITQGGPGAVFWMWLAAILGMATKFFTCTLAVMYRGKDSRGEIQGGPMYYIEVGLGKRFRFLAVFFSLCGLVGCLGVFQSNQVAGILRESYGVDPLWTGLGAAVLVALVTLGGVRRLGQVASRLVPGMCVLYLAGVIGLVLTNLDQVPVIFGQIFHDAFTGSAAVGGAAGIGFKEVVKIGVKRAIFSNEAGLGTAPMAHGAAKTAEPVREGLAAMVGPFIDTVVVCSLTAFVILLSGLWQDTGGVQGVTLTLAAFESGLGGAGKLLLVAAAVLFGLSTMFGYAYYGRKCFGYLFGAERAAVYDVIYLVTLVAGAMWSVSTVVNLIDTAFAMMALPNMIATLILAPRVMRATRRYFRERRHGDAEEGAP